MDTFPDDADGNALKSLLELGCDLSKPMDVDIQVAVPDEEVSMQIAGAAAALGFRTEIFFDEDIEDVEEATEPWTCECSKVMIVSYDSIVAAQASLNEIAKPLKCYVDGWSTFGNAD
ncbi:MAG: ribonuclease E inhibitor RraB [Pirellulaceae bacterium]|nr:ribonuclease E inhibitor RraB [Pirellulaceae bacterium]